jgi:nitroreductase
MNSEPWAFVVVRDRRLLRRLSDRAKLHLLPAHGADPRIERYRDALADPDFEIFYGAPALIVICSLSLLKTRSGYSDGAVHRTSQRL